MDIANIKLNEAIRLAGGPTKIIEQLGLKSSMAVTQWRSRGLPVDRVVDLARLTNWQVTPHQLAPKHYPNPKDALPEGGI